MKWLFVLLLALAIFGGAAWFGYNTFVKEEIEVKKEQRGEVTPPPVVDISLPEFEAAVKLRQDEKLAEVLGLTKAASGATEYSDMTAPSGGNLSYRVMAINKAGRSVPSDSVTVPASQK